MPVAPMRPVHVGIDRRWSIVSVASSSYAETFYVSQLVSINPLRGIGILSRTEKGYRRMRITTEGWLADLGDLPIVPLISSRTVVRQGFWSREFMIGRWGS